MVLPKSEACPVMLLFSFAEVLFRHSGSIVKIPFAYDIVAVKHRPCLATHDRGNQWPRAAARVRTQEFREC